MDELVCLYKCIGIFSIGPTNTKIWTISTCITVTPQIFSENFKNSKQTGEVAIVTDRFLTSIPQKGLHMDLIMYHINVGSVTNVLFCDLCIHYTYSANIMIKLFVYISPCILK